jgi:hypothetical protein
LSLPVIAGEINYGRMPAGNCMCTAGSSDVYESSKWGNCNPGNPQWCDSSGAGNACPKPPTPATSPPTPAPSSPSGDCGVDPRADPCKRQGKSQGTYKTSSRMEKGAKVSKTTVQTVSHWNIEY